MVGECWNWRKMSPANGNSSLLIFLLALDEKAEEEVAWRTVRLVYDCVCVCVWGGGEKDDVHQWLYWGRLKHFSICKLWYYYLVPALAGCEAVSTYCWWWVPEDVEIHSRAMSIRGMVTCRSSMVERKSCTSWGSGNVWCAWTIHEPHLPACMLF